MDTFHIIAGIFLFLLSLLGLLCHIYIVWRFIANNQKRNPFVFFCAAKSSFQIISCLVFFLWATPIAFFASNFIWSFTQVNYILGNICNGFCYYSVLLIQVLTSLNRLVAVISPLKYNTYCNICYAGVGWAVAASIATLFSAVWYILQFHYMFDETFLLWTPVSQEGADFSIAINLTSYFVYGTAGLALLLDVITFSKMLYDTKINNAITSAESRRRVRHNNTMFAQKVVEDCLYVIDIFNLTVMFGKYENAWWTFAFSTLSFLLVNALDGVVVIGFSAELRRPFKKLLGKSNTRVSTTIAVVQSSKTN